MVTIYMSKPEYLNKYKFDWEMLDVVIGGKSALDAIILAQALMQRE